MWVRLGMVQRVVQDMDLGWDRIIAELDALTSKELLVGIQEGAKTKYQYKKGREQDPGVSVAEYAAKNEFGTKTIPQRSFIRTAFDENIDRIESVTAKQYGEVIDGKKTLKDALGIIGQVVIGLIQRKIRAIIFPPNSRETIARKGSSKPLIDFGQMMKSVTYAIRTRKSIESQSP